MMAGAGSRGTVLLVSHAYPPQGSQGSTRPAGLAKHMTLLGHRVIVLTSGAGAGVAQGEPAAKVVRTRDLLSTRLNWRRAHIEAHEGRGADHYSSSPSFLSTVLVPDVAAYAWAPFAIAAARRVAATERIDCVITTSIPRSAHLVGVALRRRGVPWIADLRDGWRFEWPSPLRFEALHGADATLERAVLRRADAVVTVSEPVSADLRDRVGVPALTIENGFDPEAVQADDSGVELDPDRHSMAYTGRFAAGGRSLDAVIDGIGRMDAHAAARFELVVAGPLTGHEADAIEKAEVGPARVRAAGALDRPRALALQAEADSLLIVSDGRRTGELPGKFFEYLRAGRPVLVLGEQAEAARLAGRLGAGFACAARDPEAIARALARLATGETPGFDPDRLETERKRYTHEAMARRFTQLVESLRSR